jgi:hypothetical protein
MGHSVAEQAAEVGTTAEEITANSVAMWGTGEWQHVVNPDMPWNEEIRQHGHDLNAWR